jgi:serine/threonine-protein kinase
VSPPERPTDALAALPGPIALEVDEVCDDFERVWRRARRRGEPAPDPQTYLDRVSGEARTVLCSLLAALRADLLVEAEFPDVPGFAFLAEIACGPMGVVYRVRRQADDRELALKTIQSAELTRWSRPLGLLAEGELLTGLRHPHIVPVESFGEHHGLHYVVMPLVEGGDLRRRLAEFVPNGAGPGQLGRIAALMGKVADAVACLHGRGILHGDLKPSNILLTAAGEGCEPLVCDFGLARRIGEIAAPEPQLVGTLPYMAPEQMEGGRGLTAAADVWGLGAVLYELLTGRPPYHDGRRLDTQRKRADAEPPAPQDLNPAVGDAELAQVCRRCLQRDPAARYVSAAELAHDLRRLSLTPPRVDP